MDNEHEPDFISTSEREPRSPEQWAVKGLTASTRANSVRLAGAYGAQAIANLYWSGFVAGMIVQRSEPVVADAIVAAYRDIYPRAVGAASTSALGLVETWDECLEYARNNWQDHQEGRLGNDDDAPSPA